jgi:hypothetical protein
MKRLALVTGIALFYALHQDFWFWRAQEPRLFGVLPPGLWYHGIYTLACSLLMILLVRSAWPAELERRAGQPRKDSDV